MSSSISFNDFNRYGKRYEKRKYYFSQNAIKLSHFFLQRTVSNKTQQQTEFFTLCARSILNKQKLQNKNPKLVYRLERDVVLLDLICKMQFLSLYVLVLYYVRIVTY